MFHDLRDIIPELRVSFIMLREGRRVSRRQHGLTRLTLHVLSGSDYMYVHMKEYASDQSRILVADLSYMNRRIFDLSQMNRCEIMGG